MFLLLLAAAAQPVLPVGEYPQDLVQLYDQALDHLLGRGRTVDLAEAARLLRFAADRGHAEAQYNLGILSYQGKGVPQSFEESASG
jgi:TPR repeat protein